MNFQFADGNKELRRLSSPARTSGYLLGRPRACVLVDLGHACTGPGYQKTILGRRAIGAHRFLFPRKQDLPTRKHHRKGAAINTHAVGTYILPPSPDCSPSGCATPFPTTEECMNNRWLRGDTHPLGVAWAI